MGGFLGKEKNAGCWLQLTQRVKEGKAHERRDFPQCEVHGEDAKGYRQFVPGPDVLGYASPRRRNAGPPHGELAVRDGVQHDAVLGRCAVRDGTWLPKVGGPSGRQKSQVDQGCRVRAQLADDWQENPCVGFIRRDWGFAWLSEPAAAGLPLEAFILKAPNSSWTSFANRIADFSDGQAAVRALLVKAGMTVKSVMECSCHSWKHFYPAAGAQLDVHPEAVDAMGHRSPGTGKGPPTTVWRVFRERCTRRKRNASPEHHHVHPERARVRLHHPDVRALRTQKVEVMPKMMVLQTRRLRLHGYRKGAYTLCRQ